MLGVKPLSMMGDFMPPTDPLRMMESYAAAMKTGMELTAVMSDMWMAAASGHFVGKSSDQTGAYMEALQKSVVGHRTALLDVMTAGRSNGAPKPTEA